MPISHSLFKQTVLNVSAIQLQQHKIEIKMIQIILSMNSWSKSFCIFQLSMMLASFVVCLW